MKVFDQRKRRTVQASSSEECWTSIKGEHAFIMKQACNSWNQDKVLRAISIGLTTIVTVSFSFCALSRALLHLIIVALFSYPNFNSFGSEKVLSNFHLFGGKRLLRCDRLFCLAVCGLDLLKISSR